MKGKCSDLLVTKDRVGLDVSGATTGMLSDCLDTLRVTDADSVEIEDILWLKVAVVSWDATKMKKEHALEWRKKYRAALSQYFLVQNGNPNIINSIL